MTDRFKFCNIALEMKTALFAGCYLNGVEVGGGSRLERMHKYLRYYASIKDHLGIELIYLSDNGSNKSYRNDLMSESYGIPVQLAHHAWELKKTKHGGYDYPYCWRFLDDIRHVIAQGFEKILWIDTDGFILTKKLAQFTEECSNGWRSLWCARYDFPEAAYQILCADQFDNYYNFTAKHWMEFNNQVQEKILPFTHIHKEFVTDRYGEFDIPQSSDMDFYANAKLKHVLTFYS